MSKPLLVLITGMPCTGKTSLALSLSERVGLPCICKDEVKEILFEVLGYSDRARSQALGAASYELLYYFIEAVVKAGGSLIAEANFHATSSGPNLNALQVKYGFHALQILCRTEQAVLLERYERRVASNQRHPGHLDAQISGEFGALVQAGEWEPVGIDGELIVLDTTDFGAIDYDHLVNRIRSATAVE